MLEELGGGRKELEGTGNVSISLPSRLLPFSSQSLQDRTTGNGQAVSIITSIVPFLYLYLYLYLLVSSGVGCHPIYFIATTTTTLPPSLGGMVYYTPAIRMDTTAARVPHRWFYPNRKSASQLHYRPFPAGRAAGPSALSHRVVPLSCHPHGTHALRGPAVYCISINISLRRALSWIPRGTCTSLPVNTSITSSYSRTNGR